MSKAPMHCGAPMYCVGLHSRKVAAPGKGSYPVRCVNAEEACSDRCD